MCLNNSFVVTAPKTPSDFDDKIKRLLDMGVEEVKKSLFYNLGICVSCLFCLLLNFQYDFYSLLT